MEKVERDLRALTRTFDKLCVDLDKSLEDLEHPPVYREAHITFTQIEDKFERLQELQRLVLDQEEDEDKYIQEYEVFEKKRELVVALRIKTGTLALPVPDKEPSHHSAESEDFASVTSGAANKHRFRLPKLELKTFDGDVKELLAWWSQFSKIHEADDIPPEDKFQYLDQAIVPGSRAAGVIKSFPPTAANYPKAIEMLKDRFAREDMLVQVYVRELLNLVIHNASPGEKKLKLSDLYDKLESYLRALESLGRTKDKFADFLNPLVESCLPEELLRAWERKKGNEKDSGKKLTALIDFVRQEVNSEEMFAIARTGFGRDPESSEKGNRRSFPSRREKTPTAASLVATGANKYEAKAAIKSPQCLFCDKGHKSQDCYSTRTMSVADKKKIVESKKACGVCLNLGHRPSNCRSRHRCILCGDRHFPIVCEKSFKRDQVNSGDNSAPTTSNSLANQSVMANVLLMTILVKVEDARGEHRVARALIDSGSQNSYITTRLASKMGNSPIRKETMVHGLFGGSATPPVVHGVYRLFLTSMDDSYRCNFETLEQKVICGTLPSLDYEIIKSAKLDIPHDGEPHREVDILIGADVAGKLLTGGIKQLDNGLVAIETRLGWTVSGKHPNATRGELASAHLSLHTSNLTIEDLWKLDVLGIMDPIETHHKEKLASETLNRFQETIEILADGRYQVELPWKEDHCQLADNRELAKKRSGNMYRKLGIEGRLDQYQNIFNNWEEEEIIEKVPEEELELLSYYLPHRPVYKEESLTTKVRPVFDASAHGKGEVSLNDCLEKGPNMIELIPDVLDRFRSGPVGVVSDIEKAFLQVQISPPHRDYLRFFGSPEGTVYRHRRVVFGVTSSPFLLAAVINLHLRQAAPEFNAIAELLLRSFYVDNCVTSVHSEAELDEFVEKSTEIMAAARLNLRGWESNIKISPSSDRSVPVLGMSWSLQRDTLRCNLGLEFLLEEVPTTKRLALSIAQRIFDPVGFTCPATLIPKILMQELWALKIRWDDPIPEAHNKRFEAWCRQLTFLNAIEVPRFFGRKEGLEYHVFVDASAQAYAACIFARSVNAETSKVVLVRAKTRVAPTKGATIPRLELMACCIGARLAAEVQRSLKLAREDFHYWSDSTVALWWLRREGPWAVFVSNRVREIRGLTDTGAWRHVPGILNPADLPSRGCTPMKLYESRWWEGPTWLAQPPECWPKEDPETRPDEVDRERRKETMSLLVPPPEEEPWYLRHFSKYPRIIRLVAWVFRFTHNAKGGGSRGELTIEEIDLAEKGLFRSIQESTVAYWPQREHLVQGQDGLYRQKTPIVARGPEDDEDFLYPIVLPGEHPLTSRLVEHLHQTNCHAGPGMLAGIVRQKYWILGARKLVRKICSSCGRCRRFRAKALDAPRPRLPADRVRDSSVFEVTGIDFAGPLHLKEGNKVWIVIFTCAFYRAVHLELATGMSVEVFVLALKRFIARRGRPRVIYSDNGTNFVGANNALGRLDWRKIEDQAQLYRIIWKFNPPSAAWWGGWWERLIGLVKGLLKRTLGRACLRYEELLTVLVDCEAVVNSRPLTYVTEDAGDMIPLTPAMFLQDIQNSGTVDLHQLEATQLTKRARYRAELQKRLKQRFRLEYLGQLSQRPARTQTRAVKMGEIVIVGNDLQKRIDWPLGRVVEVFPGADGHVRRVRIKTPDGTMIRPIQRIYPLEIYPTSQSVPGSSQSVPGSTQSVPGSSQSFEFVPLEEDERDVLCRNITRRGRLVKVPKRYDLFNQSLFLFETLLK